MIVDSSALVAILAGEPEAPEYTRAIEDAGSVRISAANYLEAAIVIDGRRDAIGSRRFDEFVAQSGLRIEAVTEEQAMLARAAYRDFGRGCGHRAKLNFGDCFAYALAKATGEPLLFKGEDFRHTDVTAAWG